MPLIVDFKDIKEDVKVVFDSFISFVHSVLLTWCLSLRLKNVMNNFCLIKAEASKMFVMLQH